MTIEDLEQLACDAIEADNKWAADSYFKLAEARRIHDIALIQLNGGGGPPAAANGESEAEPISLTPPEEPPENPADEGGE